MEPLSRSNIYVARIFVASSFGAIAGSIATCVAHRQCVQTDMCVGILEGGVYNSVWYDWSWLWPFGDCSFATYVDLTAATAYYSTTPLLSGNSSRAYGHRFFRQISQGSCSVGERAVSLGASKPPRCVPLNWFPNAMNTEAQDSKASTPHVRACGAWLAESKSVRPSVLQSVDYMSTHNSNARVETVRRVEATMHSTSAFSPTDVSKFRRACEVAMTAGTPGVLVSARAAYEHIMRISGAAQGTDGLSVAKTLGILVGHYCEAPLALTWRVAHSKKKSPFVLRIMVTDSLPDSRVMADALRILGFSSGTQRAAEFARDKFATLMRDREQNEFVQTNTSDGDLVTSFLRGALGVPTSEWLANDRLDTVLPDAIKALRTLEWLHSSRNYAHALFTGLAASCAITAWSMVDDRAGTNRMRVWWRRLRQERPSVNALGQLAAPEALDPLFHVAEALSEQATASRLTQLVGAGTVDIPESCTALTRAMFPDEITRIHHALVVPPKLYQRMQILVSDVRTAVVRVLQTNKHIRAALSFPDIIAKLVQNASYRIPGAPANTWAASAPLNPNPSFKSTDSILVMAAKQARSHFFGRFREMALRSNNACDRPPVIDPMANTAYMWGSDLACGHHLLGMLMTPYADTRYDNESLYARAGYIVGHEHAHINLHVTARPTYIDSKINDLLAHYKRPIVTRDEAFADVLGALAVLNTGYVSSIDRLCMHISQLWCARVPLFEETISETRAARYPGPNERGDALCATLRSLVA